MERKYIWFIAIFIVIVLVGIVSLYFSFQVKGETENCEVACSSKECQDAVHSIAENMDKDVGPCQDFYSFTCGNWIRKQNRTNSMSEDMSKTFFISIRNMLDEINESETYSTARKLKTIYETCVNKSTSDTNAIPSIMEFFQKLGLGNWPNLSKDFKFEYPTLEEVIAILIEYDVFTFINFGASEKMDEKNLHPFIISGKTHISIDLAEKLMQQVLNYFRVRTQNVDNIILDFMSVSREVLSFLPKEYCIEDCEYQSVDVFCSQSPKRQMKFICDVAKYLIEHNGLEKNISSDHLILLNTSPVLVLYDLTSYYSHRTLANYIALSFLSQSMFNIHLFVRDLQLDFVKMDMPEESWNFCTEWMAFMMPELLGELYSLNRMQPWKLKKVYNIVLNSIQEAADLILEQDWIEKKERKDLSEKVINMESTLLLQMNNLFGQTFIGLKEFEPNNSSFLWNVLEYERQAFVFKLFNKIPDDVQIRIKKIFQTGAQFTPGYIDTFFGILVPPVYNYDRPAWMNIISLTSVVGHEIGHEIIHYLETEELSNQTLETLFSKTNCLTEQYSRFSLGKSGQKVNGTSTFKENLADLISIELTERMISKVMKENKGEEFICISDVPLSTRQVFYMLLTQIWCETERTEIDYNDDHAIARFRITGAMQNAKEFSKVFQCPMSSYMNPESKCSFFV